MSKDRINDLLLKPIKENLFKSIFDKEQRDVVSAEVFKALLKSDMSLYALGIYANMFLQSKKVDPSLLSKDFLLKYIKFVSEMLDIRSADPYTNLNVVTKWMENSDENMKKEAKIWEVITENSFTRIFENLSNFYTPVKSFTRNREILNLSAFVKETSVQEREDVFEELSAEIHKILLKSDDWVADIFEYKDFQKLNIPPPYSGNFDLLNIFYEQYFENTETPFDWTHLGFYILNLKEDSKVISLTTFPLKATHRESNIISTRAYFTGLHKNPTILKNTEIFFTVLESKIYNLENSVNFSNVLFRKFYMMILMQLEMEIQNIVIHIQHLIEWETEKSRNIQIKSLIRAKDAHRDRLEERKATIELVIKLVLTHNKMVRGKWKIAGPDTVFIEPKNFKLDVDVVTETRAYKLKAPFLFQKETILKLVSNLRKNSKTYRNEILSTEDKYLIDDGIESDGNNFVGQILMHVRNELVQDKTLAMKLFLDASGFFTEEMVNMQINVERERPVFILPSIEPIFEGDVFKQPTEGSDFLDQLSKLDIKDYSKDLGDLFEKFKTKSHVYWTQSPYPVWGGDPYPETIPFEQYGLVDMNLLENPVKIKGDGACFYRAVSFILWGTQAYSTDIKAAIFLTLLTNLYRTLKSQGKNLTDNDQKILKKFFQKNCEFETYNPAIFNSVLPLLLNRTVIIFWKIQPSLTFFENWDTHSKKNPLCMFFSGNHYTALPSAYTYDTWKNWRDNNKTTIVSVMDSTEDRILDGFKLALFLFMEDNIENSYFLTPGDFLYHTTT